MALVALAPWEKGLAAESGWGKKIDLFTPRQPEWRAKTGQFIADFARQSSGERPDAWLARVGGGLFVGQRPIEVWRQSGVGAFFFIEWRLQGAVEIFLHQAMEGRFWV